MKYKFSDEILARLKPLHRLNDWVGIWGLLTDVVVILAAIGITHWSIFFYPLTVLLIGSRQRALASLMHEACHKTLCSQRMLNNFIGRYCVGYPIFQSFDAYVSSHVVRHHLHLGNERLDPDHANYVANGLFEVRDRLDFVWNHVLKTIFLCNARKYMKYLFAYRFASLVGNKKECTGFVVVQLILLTVLTVAVGPLGYIMFWLVPYVTAFQVIGWFSEMSEHYPMIRSEKSALTMSRNRFPSWWEAIFIGMHGDNLHLVHHLFPGIPFWSLRDAHQVLLEDSEYRKLNERWGGILSGSKLRKSVLTQILEEMPVTTQPQANLEKI